MGYKMNAFLYKMKKRFIMIGINLLTTVVAIAARKMMHACFTNMFRFGIGDHSDENTSIWLKMQSEGSLQGMFCHYLIWAPCAGRLACLYYSTNY